jgi:cytoskeletal protein CcmA (bactofilin family)
MGHRIGLFLSCLALAGTAAAQDIVVSSSLRLGSHVDITEAVEGPLHIAAGRIRIDAPVDGSVRLAGGKVDLAPGAAIAGDASIAGGTITVTGTVKEDLHAAGGTVTINGSVGGDASIAAGTLDLGPEARIAGKLTFRGGELRRDPAAQVGGGVVQHLRDRSHRHPRTAVERFTRGWLWTGGLLVLAALIAAALPGPSRRMAQELRERPWLTPLLGLVALTSIPVAAVLLMITIIGIPIGLLALIGYAALLLVGYVWLAVVVGGLLLDRVKPETAALTAWRVGAAVLAMLALAILARLPFVGGLVAFVALIVGVGMIVGALLRRSPPAGTAQPA